MSIEIRDAQQGDLPSIMQLIEELEALQDPWRVFPPRATLVSEIGTRYAESIGDPDRRVFVALSDGEVVGTASAHIHVPSTVSEEPAVELAGMFVRPDHRSRGIARALTMEGARFAQARAVRRVTVKVFAQNEDGSRLWEGLGFEPRMLQLTAVAEQLLDRDRTERGRRGRRSAVRPP